VPDRDVQGRAWRARGWVFDWRGDFEQPARGRDGSRRAGEENPMTTVDHRFRPHPFASAMTAAWSGCDDVTIGRLSAALRRGETGVAWLSRLLLGWMVR
jgi:hypothetical protein